MISTRSIVSAYFLLMTLNASADVVDCSEAYLGVKENYEQVKCDEKYQSFLGTWTGPMESLVDFGPTPVYRKYQNTISYESKDCLRNIENGETFIIGKQTDSFPEWNGKKAKVEDKLLITGKDNKGTPFLRTVDCSSDELQSWDLIHKNDVAVISIWQIKGTQDGQPYTIETIDAQDWTVPDPSIEHKRNVTVTLQSGDFRRVLVRGYHTKQ